MSSLPKYIMTGCLLLLASCGGVGVPYKGTQSQGDHSSSQNRKSYGYVPSTVVTQKGDTVWAISRKYGVTVREIIDENKLLPPFHLKTGQRIKLPRGKEHVVQSGDTLYSVSRLYRTDVYTLSKINSLKSPYVLHVGQRLKLPGATKTVVVQHRTPPQKPVSPRKKASVTTTVKSSGPKPRVSAEPTYKPTRVAKAQPRISRKSIPKPPPRSSSRFAWPVDGRVISRFGAKRDGLRNDGINIAAKRGAPVKAAENGVVAYSGNELRGFGNMLLIKHSGGWITAYAHNEKLLVKRGQKVKKGQTIANVGSSGGVIRPQLHFEVRRGMNPVNPKKFLGS
ncbi:LysM peptidoglycan-binding domain-containing M23 family metallopeptidase [Terasakiella sp. SH-1]|uniref:LysM peptidoglycan-binding domain-containing M23 family metallopeptidase n=1 Tax=Terasakiella sp. SH-1 TaxID=2560057 RepID=UPI00142F55DF|nr:LysM peptidoglycan-binding domain-containing M23 family metallopeptidase [Terasakiella sp. SH-1]